MRPSGTRARHRGRSARRSVTTKSWSLDALGVSGLDLGSWTGRRSAGPPSRSEEGAVAGIGMACGLRVSAPTRVALAGRRRLPGRTPGGAMGAHWIRSIRTAPSPNSSEECRSAVCKICAAPSPNSSDECRSAVCKICAGRDLDARRQDAHRLADQFVDRESSERSRPRRSAISTAISGTVCPRRSAAARV
jgi:hypothetical protein